MKRMVVLCAILPALAQAGTESQIGLGLGTQYGGFAGFKYSVNLDTNKFYVGAGRAEIKDEEYGITLGWEKSLTDKHAVGVAIRTKTLTAGGNYVIGSFPDSYTSYPAKDGYESFIAGTYTYYFGKSSEAGFLTGLSAGKEYLHNNAPDKLQSGIRVGMYFGYQF